MNADLLHSDVREYRMPSGVISPEGFREIYGYVACRWNCFPVKEGVDFPQTAYLHPDRVIEHIGNEVLVKGTGKYVGTFTKRYSKYLYNKVGLKIPSEDLSEIGNIVERNSVNNPSYYIDFTQEFEWHPGDFGDPGSCFWSCRKDARLILKDNGAYAVRFYESLNGRGKGRAWLAPYNGAWIVFNAYGPYQKFEIARVLAHQWGVSYKSMDSLTNNGSMDKMLYINCAGVVIAPSKDIEDTYKGPIEVDLGWDERPQSIRCHRCSRVHNRADTTRDPWSGLDICPTCMAIHYFSCNRCSRPTQLRDRFDHPDGSEMCHLCASATGATYCDECMILGWDRTLQGSMYVCEACYSANYQPCQECNRVLRYTSLYNTGEKTVCNRCRPERQLSDLPTGHTVTLDERYFPPSGWASGTLLSSDLINAGRYAWNTVTTSGTGGTIAFEAWEDTNNGE